MLHTPELWDTLLAVSRLEGGVSLWLCSVFKEGSSGKPGIPP